MQPKPICFASLTVADGKLFPLPSKIDRGRGPRLAKQTTCNEKGLAMPVSIVDLARNRRTFEHMTDYGAVRVTYRPYQMTPAREAEIAELAAESRDMDENRDVNDTKQGITKIITQFTEVVEAWDLVGPLHTKPEGQGELIVPDGEPIPIKPEILKYVSSFFLVGVLNDIARDARPKKGQREN